MNTLKKLLKNKSLFEKVRMVGIDTISLGSYRAEKRRNAKIMLKSISKRRIITKGEQDEHTQEGSTV